MNIYIMFEFIIYIYIIIKLSQGLKFIYNFSNFILFYYLMQSEELGSCLK